MKKYIFLISILAFSINSCKKDNESDSKNKYPVITTTVVYDITQTTAKSGGTISNTGEDPIIEAGVCWDSVVPTVYSNKTVDPVVDSTFNSSINNLVPGTLYCVRAYIKNKKGVFYAKLITFNSKKVVKLPVVSKTKISKYTQTTAIGQSKITYDGDSAISETGVCWSTSENPTINDNKTTGKLILSDIKYEIQGLSPATEYYARAYATNSAGTGYGDQIKFRTSYIIPGIKFNPDLTYGEVTDIEGNVYKTIIIGNQVWMAENLRTTKFNDGTKIPLVLIDGKWIFLETPAYCWYNDDSASYSSNYGALYNWYVVKTSKICPTGWRVPDITDWLTLDNYLGTGLISKGKLKEIETLHWTKTNTKVTNGSGFSAIPAGLRDVKFFNIGYNTSFWSSSKMDEWNSKYFLLDNDSTHVNSDPYNNESANDVGMSIRCIKN